MLEKIFKKFLVLVTCLNCSFFRQFPLFHRRSLSACRSASSFSTTFNRI
eukprot:UN04237